MIKKIFKNKGFFLVEMMVSLSIFTLVAVSTAGALLSLVDANMKAQGLKSVMDNLGTAVENMSRSIHLGINYTCNGTAINGECAGTSGVSFKSKKDGSIQDVRYYLLNGSIYRSINSGTGVAMTAPEVTISSLQFFIYGVEASDNGQPRVLISINGKAGLVASVQSLFNIQTTASQRQIDS